MSSPPPRAPFCLNTTTSRPWPHSFGFGLLTRPDRSVPSARMVTVVFAGAAAGPATDPVATPANATSRPVARTGAVSGDSFMADLLGRRALGVEPALGGS